MKEQLQLHMDGNKFAGISFLSQKKDVQKPAGFMIKENTITMIVPR